MKIQCPYKCDGDGCTKQKGEGNKWLLLVPDGLCFVARPWDQELVDIDERRPEWPENSIKHYCGIGCLSKALSAWQAKHGASPVEEAKA
jgi:hypothetical protein